MMRVAEMHGVVGLHLHTRQLCFLQLFLRHTLRGTLQELVGAGMHSRRIEEGLRGSRGGGQQSCISSLIIQISFGLFM